MTALTDAAPASRRRRRPDQVVVSSGWMFVTQAAMSASGLAFWLVAARLQAPAEVGYAGSLITAMVVLSLFAQVGLEVTLVQVLPTSSRPRGDIVCVTLVVGATGALLGLGYALVIGMFSSGLGDVLGGPFGPVEFAVLVAGFAVNGFSDAALLAVSRLRANLLVNGLLLGALKLLLPVVLVSYGALGLVLAAGVATLVAGVVSIVVALRAVPGSLRPRPSPELRAAGTFARAGYVVAVLDVVPFLVLPVLVIQVHGAATGGAYFLAVQVALLLLAVGISLNNAMYAEASKRPQEAPAIVRRAGRLLAVALGGGALVLAAAAPVVMAVFGPAYAAEGVPLLRLMAIATVFAGAASWSALRLRVRGHLGTMMATYVLGTVLVLGLAWWWVGLGAWGVVVAWAVGRAVTFLLNLALGLRR